MTPDYSKRFDCTPTHCAYQKLGNFTLYKYLNFMLLLWVKILYKFPYVVTISNSFNNHLDTQKTTTTPTSFVLPTHTEIEN